MNEDKAKGSDEKAADDRPSKSSGGKQPTMRVKIYGPFNVYVDEDAYSISAANLTGPFDVLPRHHNFITILEACDIVVKTPYDIKTITISRGVMHVRTDKVTVFLDV